MNKQTKVCALVHFDLLQHPSSDNGGCEGENKDFAVSCFKDKFPGLWLRGHGKAPHLSVKRYLQ